jgi:hypothetical protein
MPPNSVSIIGCPCAVSVEGEDAPAGDAPSDRTTWAAGLRPASVSGLSQPAACRRSREWRGMSVSMFSSRRQYRRDETGESIQSKKYALARSCVSLGSNWELPGVIFVELHPDYDDTEWLESRSITSVHSLRCQPVNGFASEAVVGAASISSQPVIPLPLTTNRGSSIFWCLRISL